jgi:hypothetical protein
VVYCWCGFHGCMSESMSGSRRAAAPGGSRRTHDYLASYRRVRSTRARGGESRPRRTPSPSRTARSASGGRSAIAAGVPTTPSRSSPPRRGSGAGGSPRAGSKRPMSWRAPDSARSASSAERSRPSPRTYDHAGVQLARAERRCRSALDSADERAAFAAFAGLDAAARTVDIKNRRRPGSSMPRPRSSMRASIPSRSASLSSGSPRGPRITTATATIASRAISAPQSARVACGAAARCGARERISWPRLADSRSSSTAACFRSRGRAVPARRSGRA